MTAPMPLPPGTPHLSAGGAAHRRVRVVYEHVLIDGALMPEGVLVNPGDG